MKSEKGQIFYWKSAVNENSQLMFETQVLTTAATGTSGKSREKEKGSLQSWPAFGNANTAFVSLCVDVLWPRLGIPKSPIR